MLGFCKSEDRHSRGGLPLKLAVSDGRRVATSPLYFGRIDTFMASDALGSLAVTLWPTPHGKLTLQQMQLVLLR